MYLPSCALGVKLAILQKCVYNENAAENALRCIFKVKRMAKLCRQLQAGS